MSRNYREGSGYRDYGVVDHTNQSTRLQHGRDVKKLLDFEGYGPRFKGHHRSEQIFSFYSDGELKGVRAKKHIRNKFSPSDLAQVSGVVNSNRSGRRM